MTPDAIGPDLKTTLKRLRLGRTLDTLPERLLLARQQKMPHADQMLKALRHARLDNNYEAELRKLIAVDLLILDDFALDAMDPTESRDAYEILTERHRAGSMIVTSNRGPDEWLATFADPIRAQSAIDRFTGNSYDLIIEGESYRPRLKPKLRSGQPEAA